MADIEILNGDSRELLRGFPDDHFHACVTDPPYGLVSITKRFGKPGSAPAKHGTDGVFARSSKGFMGQEWDGTGIERDPAFWAEVFRVMRPGAFLVAFGGTRTAHRIACAIEDAGFEIRDSLAWIYSQGFPKSHDVSKQLDKRAGAEREVISRTPRHGNPINTQGKGGTVNRRPWMDRQIEEYGGLIDTKTLPTTDDAKAWDGWGTAMKPAIEPILLARKPLSEKSVADNVLRWGCGCLNIGASRVGAGAERPARDPHIQTGASNWGNGTMSGGSRAIGTTTEGRWPPNVLLQHDDSCVRKVWKQVTFEGEEELPEEWRCAPGCPVQELTRQSGTSRSPVPGSFKREMTSRGYQGGGFGQMRAENHPPVDLIKPGYSDEGTADRFFPRFQCDEEDLQIYVPFMYCPKAGSTERNAGLEGAPTRTRHRVNPGGLEHDPRWGPIQAKNNHPTVKPVSLMRWLVRLVCPPGGIVLDPFLGSGTTALACREEGFNAVGIEREEAWAEIARGRVHPKPLRDGQLSLFLEEA